MESAGERTEKATPKKRKDARERGQVRKSTELVTAIMLLIMFGLLSLIGTSLWNSLKELVYDTACGVGFPDEGITKATIGPLLLNAVLKYAIMLAPVLACAFLAGLLSNILQIGFLFSTKALKPKMSRLNPLQGLKRMFSLRTLFELAKTLVKVIVVGIIAYTQYANAIQRFSSYTAASVERSIADIMEVILDTAFTIAFALLIIAALDFVYQWFKYEKDLKMTKYEVKMEYKQLEGDPQIKGKIKSKQRQMAMMRTMQAVPEADVVITNPTHYAVALKYEDGVNKAPVVIAKGADHIAMKIKEIARESKVEIVENKPVAQGLYNMCEVGQEVPVELYQAVAEILAYVYKLKNKK